MTDWNKLEEIKLKTGSTREDYCEYVRDRIYYDVKTWFIREFLSDSNQVIMYTRPRRFGKTLMLSTIRAFVEKEYDRNGHLIDKRPFFEGRKIMTAEPEILAQMGQYPRPRRKPRQRPRQLLGRGSRGVERSVRHLEPA